MSPKRKYLKIFLIIKGDKKKELVERQHRKTFKLSF